MPRLSDRVFLADTISGITSLVRFQADQGVNEMSIRTEFTVGAARDSQISLDLVAANRNRSMLQRETVRLIRARVCIRRGRF